MSVSGVFPRGKQKYRHGRHWPGALLLLGLSLLLAACAAPAVAPRAAGQGSLVFGHLTVPHRLRHVYLYQVGHAYIGTLNMPRATVYRNGDFVFANLSPGDYYLAGFTDLSTTYWLNYSKSSLQRALLHIGQNQVLFAGSFQVTNVESKAFGNGSFDIRRVTQPTEVELLQRLRILAHGSGWGSLIDARLKALR